MDPVSLPRLLDAIDTLDRQTSTLTRSEFASQLKYTPKRASEVLRVLREISLIVFDRDTVAMTPECQKFINFWDQGDIQNINAVLSLYTPYSVFLDFMRQEQCIVLPNRASKIEKQTLAICVSEDARQKLTYVALDTFRYWGSTLGQIYVTCFSEPIMVWTGASPSLEEFIVSLFEAWKLTASADGYAHLAYVAEKVCTKLHLSFPCFESMFVEMLRKRPELVYVSSSALRPITKRAQVPTLQPRSDIIRQHGVRPRGEQWITSRYLEDGVRVGERFMRFMKWMDKHEL